MSRNIVGIHYGHNASVALAKDGKIVFALAEERPSRIKNFTGFPVQAYKIMLEKYFDGKPDVIDTVVIPAETVMTYLHYHCNNQFKDGRYSAYFKGPPSVHKAIRKENYGYFKWFCWKDQLNFRRLCKKRQLQDAFVKILTDQLGIGAEKLVFINHHAAHAYSACLNLQQHNEKSVIFTLDGSGDYLCASVNLFENGNLTVLSKNIRYPSPGIFYRQVTGFLGMKPDEHEFKVMGLAPYASNSLVKQVYDKFAPLIWVNNKLEFESLFPMEYMKDFLIQHCTFDRFDLIAAAAQQLLENRVTEWVRKWLEKTGASRIGLSGGVFMNVKLNQKLAELTEVKDVFVVPSAGDESLVMGCCYYGSTINGETIQPVKDLYLGCAHSDDEIEQYLRDNKIAARCHISKEECITEKIAELLAAGNAVGNFAGRDEWGARALGNRSLLADPRNRDTIRVINEMIKGRDFWMPFTPSIIAEDLDRYIENPKHIEAPYMAITFDSTLLGRTCFQAAVHPYDFTMRPQAVFKDWNPRYYDILTRFKTKTGVSGILNTSLNLHGLPNVFRIEDAIHLLDNSDLKHIALENWLVSKK